MLEMLGLIAGGLLLGALSKNDKKKVKRTSLLNGRFLNQIPAIDSNSKYSEWRLDWEKTIDRTRWKPKSVASQIIQKFPPRENGDVILLDLAQYGRFEKALLKEFESDNLKFLALQKEKLAHFFSSVENNALTDEQMDSCICMDDAVQIVAAAGSGKTSAIVARIGYALKEDLVKSGDILVLAFNTSVKRELEARIKRRLADIDGVENINVKTFNAFGLEVIGKCTGRKPRVADWVNSGKDITAMSNIVDDLKKRDRQFSLDWDMFRTIFGRNINNSETTVGSLTGEDENLQTADGTIVKSQEERMISDFLFYHGIEYQYERPYEHDTVSEAHSQYQPDFYYPDIGLYHEHFALDANGKAPSHFTGDYVAGVAWKRQLHTQNGTLLFETTSHGIRSGDDLERLRNTLKERGLNPVFNSERKARGQEPITTKQLISTLRSFQQHAKSNNLNFTDIYEVIADLDRGHRNRLKRFVSLYERVANEWQRRLSSEESVDFDDMLLRAIRHIESGEFQRPYKMILVDEFQDVSQAKVRLLKALKQSAGPSSNLCVVGDDWQGINRFAGADLSVMTSFLTGFENSTQLTLSKTFRCPQILCDVSSDFIQKNPLQIRKNVVSANIYADKPVLAFAANSSRAAADQLESDLRDLYQSLSPTVPNSRDLRMTKVMLIGRYRHDVPVDLARWQAEFRQRLLISFSTAHKAKGLEADYAMLLNLSNGRMGFPNRIADDSVLELVMPQADQYPFAEERRLFYVALTRAKRQTKIYSIENKISPFLRELAKDGHLEIETDNGTLTFCPNCATGTLRELEGKHGFFEACSSRVDCGFTRSVSRSSLDRKAYKLSPRRECKSEIESWRENMLALGYSSGPTFQSIQELSDWEKHNTRAHVRRRNNDGFEVFFT